MNQKNEEFVKEVTMKTISFMKSYVMIHAEKNGFKDDFETICKLHMTIGANFLANGYMNIYSAMKNDSQKAELDEVFDIIYTDLRKALGEYKNDMSSS